jgi:hypothetical protein
MALYKEMTIKVTVVFLADTLQDSTDWEDIFKILRK